MIPHTNSYIHLRRFLYLYQINCAFYCLNKGLGPGGCCLGATPGGMDDSWMQNDRPVFENTGHDFVVYTVTDIKIVSCFFKNRSIVLHPAGVSALGTFLQPQFRGILPPPLVDSRRLSPPSEFEAGIQPRPSCATIGKPRDQRVILPPRAVDLRLRTPMVSTRRSARLRQAIQEGARSNDGGEDCDTREEGPDPTTGQGRKSGALRKVTPKQNGKQRGKRRNAGNLSLLPDMPLDILREVSAWTISVTDDGYTHGGASGVQILSLVCPVDLLRMSWANKTFRNVLTSNSSRQIWIAAFDNIPEARRPPPRPEDLTEIGYANLLYNPCCRVRVCVHAFHLVWLMCADRAVVLRVPQRSGGLS